MGDERPPKLRVLDGREDGIFSVPLFFVREVDAGHDALQEAAGEDRDHDVRGLGLAVRAGYGAGLDRHEGELAAVHGPGTPEAGEVLVEGQVIPVVCGMVVAARPIRLPYLDHRVGHDFAGAVVDRAFDLYRLGVIRRDQLRTVSIQERVVEEGTYCLRGGKLRGHLRFSIGVAFRPSSTMSNL